jgi:hypothetical protein
MNIDLEFETQCRKCRGGGTYYDHGDTMQAASRGEGP